MGTWLLHENEHKTLQIIVNTVFPYQHQTSPSNLHRHQKKQKKQNQSHKTLASTKKRKKNPSIYSGFWTPIGWKSLFFLALFGACQCFVRLCFVFFLLFLVPANVLRDQSHQTLTRKKNTTTRCTKLWQAPKKKSSINSGFWNPIDWKSLFFLPFLVPANVLWGCALFFFGACHCFSSIITKQDAKMCVSPRFQSHQMQKTSAFRMFCAHFHSKITSPWSPALLINWVGGLECLKPRARSFWAG